METGSFTLRPEHMTFNELTLATPLPTPLEDECDGGGNDHEDDDSDDSKKGDDDEDKPDAAGKIAMPWLGVVSAIVLGLAV